MKRAGLTANSIFRSLSTTPGWATCSRKVRWLAARYYAGVDSVDELRRCAEKGPGDYRPLLTVDEVATIILWR